MPDQRSKPKQPEDAPDRRAHMEALLEEGLRESFPASDPVAITDPSTGIGSAARTAGSGGDLPGSGPHDRSEAVDAPLLDYWKASPQGLAALGHLNAYVEGCGLEHSLLDLVKTRASQINGCAYCLDMHTKDARAAGESEQRLHTLCAWRETPFFSDRERAALAWTEAVTRIAGHQVEDRLYKEMRRQFSEKEIVDLTLAVIVINGWNRLAIPFRTPAGSYQP